MMKFSQVMKWLLVSVALVVFTACGGGDVPISQKLSDATIVYSSSPTLNKEFNLTIEEADDDTKQQKNQQKISNSQYVWSVVSQPDGADLVLTPSTDGKTVTCTPTVAGKYVLKVVYNNESKEIEFFINKDYSVDATKIEGYDGTSDLSMVEGMVKNQIWVYSNSLTKNEIETIIAKYPIFTTIDFDEVQGLLIEFDETDSSLQENIEKLKLESGIDSLDYRYYEGNDVIKQTEKISNDGSAFNDGGDNWHLEYIHIDKAWDITTGSKDFLIGITDGIGKYYSTHEDLKGKFDSVTTMTEKTIKNCKDNWTNYTDEDCEELGEHGTGVAGSIGAISNNKKGISGINWNTKLVGKKSGYNNLLNTIKMKKVLLTSNSWALAGYLPKDFDPLDKKKVAKRDKDVLAKTRAYRRLAKYFKKNKLFVFSAGNGIGNGIGYKGFYGVDGRHHSPALHYDKDGKLNKQKNVMFVAALLKDSKLAYYSNFGESIDIAAPTGYKSTKKDNILFDDYYEADKTEYYGTTKSGGFEGTSAAAPVVSGVASLIFSVNKDFTGADIKSILINSAIDTVKERYTKPNKTSTIKLAHEIPILNAESALKMAKDIMDGKIVNITHTIQNPFNAEATVIISSANSKLEVEESSFDLATSSVGNPWKFINSFSGDNKVKIPLDANSSRYRVTGSAKLKGISVKPTYDEEFVIPKTTLTIEDSITLAKIPNASVEIEPMFFNIAIPFFKSIGTVDAEGKTNLYLTSGKYKIIVSSTQYTKTSTQIVTISEKEDNNIKITMGEVGNLSGKVLDLLGKPIVGATVRLSGGEQTNGFVYSATTDSAGVYNISNISKKDTKGKPIVSFTLSATATGYKESIKENVVIITSNTVSYNFNLEEQEIKPETVIYSTSFESDENSNWVATGLWHIQELKTETSIVNTLVDDGFVTIPPDEASEHAYLPKADDGDSVMWYGLSDTGSFINSQKNGDELKSGGTSTSSHSGTIISPSIDLTNAAYPILRFKTWWEIEAVNPNENGYDLMDIKISVDDGEFTAIKRLNPHVDPNISDRNSKGFSSAGVFRKPVWVQEELILKDYIGHSIKIQFSFDTRDELYNGFRGWILDNLSVLEGTVPTNSSSNKMSKMYYKESNVKTKTIFDGLSEEYIELHKKPKKIEEVKTLQR